MSEFGTAVVNDAHVADLTEEIRRLRAELVASRATSARALARATRLAQLVSALGQLTDVTQILERAVCEVAEQFSCDIAVVLTAAADGGAGVQVAAQWGIAAKHLPAGRCAPPVDTSQLTSMFPVAAGPVGEFTPPDWLRPSRPRHLAVGLLTVRDTHFGYLLLARRADEPFASVEVQELTAVVSRIAVAVDSGLLYRRTQEQLHRLKRLHEVTAALAGIVDLDDAVRTIATTLVAEVPVAGAAVYLSGDRGLELSGCAGEVGAMPRQLADDYRPVAAETTLVDLGTGPERLGVLSLTGAPAPHSEAGYFLEHLADISRLALEKALLFAQIRGRAETDALTGLPNRSLFMQRLSSALVRCHQTDADLAVVFVDLDGFKAINDTYGHDAGDQLLVQAAGRLSRTVNVSDVAARLGGDEFVVMCEARASILELIEQAMNQPYHLDLHSSGPVVVNAGGSIGVSTAKHAGYDASQLLRQADAAMYAAKQRRRATP